MLVLAVLIVMLRILRLLGALKRLLVAQMRVSKAKCIPVCLLRFLLPVWLVLLVWLIRLERLVLSVEGVDVMALAVDCVVQRALAFVGWDTISVLLAESFDQLAQLLIDLPLIFLLLHLRGNPRVSGKPTQLGIRILLELFDGLLAKDLDLLPAVQPLELIAPDSVFYQELGDLVHVQLSEIGIGPAERSLWLISFVHILPEILVVSRSLQRLLHVANPTMPTRRVAQSFEIQPSLSLLRDHKALG